MKTPATLQHTRFVFLLGPTNVGKTFITKLIYRILAVLASQGLKVGLISFGRIIRGLRETDPAFEAAYGPSIDRGQLVDDPKAIEIFQAEIDKIAVEGGYDIVFVDGFCRSVTQIDYASQNGYLQAKDRVFFIEASAKTCMKRWSRRKSTGQRPDDTEIETFHGRYHLHTSTAPDLRNLFKENDAPVIDIDGGHGCKDDEKDLNGDMFIAEFTFPNLFAHLLPMVCEIAARKRPADAVEATAA